MHCCTASFTFQFGPQFSLLCSIRFFCPHPLLCRALMFSRDPLSGVQRQLDFKWSLRLFWAESHHESQQAEKAVKKADGLMIGSSSRLPEGMSLINTFKKDRSVGVRWYCNNISPTKTYLLRWDSIKLNTELLFKNSSSNKHTVNDAYQSDKGSL